MGIFSDLRANAKTLDLERPAEGSRRVVINDLERLERHYGDQDYPAGLTARPAYAILVVTRVLTEPYPNRGEISPITSALEPDPHSPKEATIRALAAEAAIEARNPDLTEAILGEIKYEVAPSNNKPAPIPEFIPQSGLVDDYNAASLALGDGADVLSWDSDVGSDTLNRYYTGVAMAPIYRATSAMNGQPAVDLDQVGPGNFDVVGMESSLQTPFDGRTGTFAIAFQFLQPASLSQLLNCGTWTMFGASFSHAERPLACNMDGIIGPGLEKPAADITLDNTQIWVIWRDDDRLEFRRNGVQKTGKTLVGNPAPVAGQLKWCALTAKGNSCSILVARIMRWDRVLTTEELTDVEVTLSGLYT